MSISDFSCLFENCMVDNIITTSLDHYAMVASLTNDPRRFSQHPVVQSFGYEAMWWRAPDYNDVLELAWTTGSEGPIPFVRHG
jgi:hypothetical protein